VDLDFPNTDIDDEWVNGDIDAMIASLETELAEVEDVTKKDFGELQGMVDGYYDQKSKAWEALVTLSEVPELNPDPILNEICCFEFKKVNDDYIAYYEKAKKYDSEPEAIVQTTSSLGLRKPTVNEEDDIVCSVCYDGDYEDDNLIVICSTCECAFHM